MTERVEEAVRESFAAIEVDPAARPWDVTDLARRGRRRRSRRNGAIALAVALVVGVGGLNLAASLPPDRPVVPPMAQVRNGTVASTAGLDVPGRLPDGRTFQPRAVLGHVVFGTALAGSERVSVRYDLRTGAAEDVIGVPGPDDLDGAVAASDGYAVWLTTAGRGDDLTASIWAIGATGPPMQVEHAAVESTGLTLAIDGEQVYWALDTGLRGGSTALVRTAKVDGTGRREIPGTAGLRVAAGPVFGKPVAGPRWPSTGGTFESVDVGDAGVRGVADRSLRPVRRANHDDARCGVRWCVITPLDDEWAAAGGMIVRRVDGSDPRSLPAALDFGARPQAWPDRFVVNQIGTRWYVYDIAANRNLALPATDGDEHARAVRTAGRWLLRRAPDGRWRALDLRTLPA